MTPAQVYGLARAVGLPHRRALVATAIAGAESGWNPRAIGDVDLEDDTWGPSVGLWQIRSLRAQYGTGGPRDASRLTDPGFNARSMFQISNGGRSWSPWSTFNDRAYAGFVPQVRDSVGGGAAGSYPAPDTPPGSSYSDATPISVGSDLGVTLWGLLGLPDQQALRNAAIVGAFVVGGIVLVLVGTSATLQPTLRKFGASVGATA